MKEKLNLFALTKEEERKVLGGYNCATQYTCVKNGKKWQQKAYNAMPICNWNGEPR